MKFEIPQLSDEQRARVQQAEDILSEVAKLDATLASKERDIKQAEATKVEASNKLAERDTDLALAASEATAAPIEQDVKRLTAQLVEAQLNLDRQLRIRGALLVRLNAAESALAEEKSGFEKFVRMHSSEVSNALGDQIDEAVRPLVEALRYAVVASSCSGGAVQGRLADMSLPDIRGNVHLLLGLNMSAYLDGERIPLSDTLGDVRLEELARVVGGPRRTLAKLTGQVSRAERRRKADHVAQCQSPSVAQPNLEAQPRARGVAGQLLDAPDTVYPQPEVGSSNSSLKPAQQAIEAAPEDDF